MKSAPELARAAVQVADPTRGLAAVAELRVRLEALEEMHVENALRAGLSWSRIAAFLGVSKQAAHKKHARRVAPERASPSATVERANRVVITGEARRAVRSAREEAAELGAVALLPEHLLVGVLRDPGGRVARALGPLGVSAGNVRNLLAARAAVAAGIPPASASSMPIARRARTVLERSLRESVERGDAHLGVEHIALALLRDRRGDAAKVLRELGVAPAAAQDRLGTAPAE